MNRCLHCWRMAQDTLRLVQHRPIYTARILLFSSGGDNDKNSMIRVIGAKGKSLGIMHKQEAEQVAKKENLTLKHVANASESITNSVYKLVELKTPSTLATRAVTGAVKKQPQQQSEKELTMKSQIQDNDLNVKAKKLQQFLDRGYQVTIKIVKPRRVTISPRDTYERLVSKLDCEVILKGTPKVSGSFFRGIVTAKNTPK